jgi:hypothetical protein
MITKQQAIEATEFHCGDCTRTVGPRGGVRISSEVWRRNGRTQTWKTRPDAFSVPVKHGLSDYFTVTQHCDGWHVAMDCPLLAFAELPQTVATRMAIVYRGMGQAPFEESSGRADPIHQRPAQGSRRLGRVVAALRRADETRRRRAHADPRSHRARAMNVGEQAALERVLP